MFLLIVSSLFINRLVTFTLFQSPTLPKGDDDEEESGEERLPSCFDYIMHFLTVFWKVLFAFVPPTEYWNGWACFIVSISLIGVLTAVTGDLASHFGCTIGLKDSVTAVVFVALGTSVPGEDEWGRALLFDFKSQSKHQNIHHHTLINGQLIKNIRKRFWDLYFFYIVFTFQTTWLDWVKIQTFNNAYIVLSMLMIGQNG